MAVSDGSGEVLYRFVYDTYGELSDIRTSDNISLRTLEEANDYTLEELAHAAGFTYLYNGQYGVATDQNGLYYMRARYYDQDIKRFINRDIISGDIGNSKSLNRYAYVQGNPVSLTDPFGLCPDSNSSVRLVRTFMCDTDWSTVGHTALDIVGIFWDGADVINAFWYAAEGNTEMAIASAVYALPGIGMAGGRLMMCSDKLYKAGKAVYRASKLTQGCYGVIAGLTMAGAGIGNIYNSLKNGEKISFKDIALAVGGTAIAIFSGKTMVSDMRQMLGISNKVDRTIKVGNADISHEPVPSEKKILEAAESGSTSRIKVDSYNNMRSDPNVTGQAHHLSQNAVFKNDIPQKDGLCIELDGNAFSDIGSPHYEAHSYLEGFWNQYRKGGNLYRKTPTIGEYNRAVYDSLLSTNKFTRREAAYAVRKAYEQQQSAGFINSDFVPRIPGRLPQKK